MVKTLLAIVAFVAPMHAIGAVSYICEYQKFADRKGFAEAKDFVLTFIIDPQKGSAYMVGNNGAASVESVYNSESKSVTFIEITATKNVMLTTIDSGLRSVHSRHSVMFGELIESQYYGTCKSK